MVNRRLKEFLGAILLVAVVLLGVYWYTYKAPVASVDTQQNQVVTQPPAQVTPQASKVILTVQGVYQDIDVPLSTDESVLQVLEALNAQDTRLQLAKKEYKGLGTLIEGMGDLKNGTDQKYWQYKVNGVAPQIGADAYKLKADDKIEWFFAPSQQ